MVKYKIKLLYLFFMYLTLPCLCNFENSISPVDNEYGETEKFQKVKLRRDLDKITQELVADKNHEYSLYHSYIFKTGVGNRQELEVRNISMDAGYGEDVIAWQSMQSAGLVYLLGRRSYSVSLTTTSVQLSFSQTPSFFRESVDIGDKISSTLLFSRWNTTTSKEEVIVAVATEGDISDIKFYRVTDRKMILIRSLAQYTKINAMATVKVNEINYLVTVDSGPKAFVSIINMLFSYDGIDIEFRLVQSLTLPGECSAVTVCGASLAFVLPEAVHLYRRLADGHFTNHTILQHSGVTQAIAFQMAQQYYLALNGNNPSILRLTESEELIATLTLYYASDWLVVPIASYRSDVMLFSKHNNETNLFVWAGVDKGFKIKPIDQYESFLDGLWPGAVSVPYRNGRTDLVIPQSSRTSNLIFIETYLNEDIDSPVVEKYKSFNESMNRLEEQWRALKIRISKAEDALKHVLNRDGNNIITAKWKLNQVETNRLQMNQVVQPGSEVNITEDTLRKTGDIAGLKQLIENTLNSTNQLKEMVMMKEEQVWDLKNYTGKIKFDGNLTVGNLTVTKLNDIYMDDLLQNTYRLNKPKKIYSLVVVEGSLETENIDFAKVNNVSTNNIKFSDGPVHFNQTITLLSPLAVEGDLELSSGGQLNGMNLTSDICNGEPFCTVSPVNSIDVRGGEVNDGLDLVKTGDNHTWTRVIGGTNLTVLKINDMDLEQLFDQIIYKDRYQIINGTVKVNGTVTSVPAIVLGHIERRYYPSEKDPVADGSDIVGVAQKFKVAEPIERFQDVIFTNLEVTGTVTAVTSEWGSAAADLVLSDDGNIQIHSAKTFGSPVVIDSLNVKGPVSGVNLSDLLTSDTHQTFYGVVKLDGHVALGNVTLDGKLYGSKVNEESYEEAGFVQEVTADRIRVLETLNDIPISELVLTDRWNNTHITELEAQQVHVTQNITVNGKLCGYYLEQFEKEILSKSKEQNITGDFEIVEANITKEFRVDDVNNKIMIDNSHEIESDESDIVHLAELHVEGNITTEFGVNGFNLTDLASNAVGLLSNNYIKGRLHFKDEVQFDFLECQGFFNNKLCNQWLDERDIVYNTGEPITISGQVTFLKPLNILGDVDVEGINNHKVQDIFTTETEQQITGDLHITGDIALNAESTVVGLLNNQNISVLAKRCSVSGEIIECEGNAIFRNNVEVEHFSTKHINNRNFEKFVDSLVNYKKTKLISGFKKFTAKTTKVNNLFTKKINGRDWNEFLLNAVTQGEVDQVTVPVSFGSLVTMDDLSVDGDINAFSINGVNIRDWKTDAIYLNESFHLKRNLCLRSASSRGNLLIDNYDGVNLEIDIVKLNSDNSPIGSLVFESIEVTGRAEFEGTVNGHPLKHLEENTLKSSGNQRVTTDLLLMTDLTVTGNMNVTGLVNDHYLTDVVTLGTSQTLQGNYEFECIKALKNVSVSGLMSDVDLEEWGETAVLQGSNQAVEGEWRVLGDVEVKGPVSGRGRLGKVELAELKQNITRDILDVYHQMKDNLTYSCEEANSRLGEARRSTSDVLYIDVSQELSVSSSISHVHYFENGTDHFLALSENSCTTTMYRWNNTSGRFVKLHTVDIGFAMSQVVVLLYNSSTYLLTDSSDQPQACSVAGRHVWELTASHLQYLGSMDYMQGHILRQGEQNYMFSMNKTGVYKWQLDIINGSPSFRTVDKWIVDTAGKRFVPQGARLGLSILDTVEIVNLDSEVVMMPDMYTNCTGEIQSMSADPSGRFIAVATMERAQVPRHADHVKVYQHETKQLFDKLPAQQASHLQWLTVPGQTWLVFLQNNTSVHFYHLQDYLKGFQLKIAAEMEAVSLTAVSLPVAAKVNLQPYLMVQTSRTVRILQPVLLGDPYLGPDLTCSYHHLSLIPQN